MNRRSSVTVMCIMVVSLLQGRLAMSDTVLTPDIEFAALSRSPKVMTVAQATPAAASVAPPSLDIGTPGLTPDATPESGTGKTLPLSLSTNKPAPTVTDTPELIPIEAANDPSVDENLISVALDDVPLQDVVRLFTRISGANIIATSTNLHGKVTVNLQDVEWQPALISILDIHNLTIFEKTPGSKIFSVISKPPGAAEPMIAQPVFLNYTSVSNTMSIVAAMVDKGGSVSAFPNANALIVRSSAASLNEIRKVITEIDLPRKQVYIEAKFLELTDEAIKDLGINWQVLQGYSVGVGGMSWNMTENRDKVKGDSKTLAVTDSRSKSDTINKRYDSTGTPYDESTTETTYDPNGNPIVNVVPTPTRSVVDSINQSSIASKNIEDSFTKTASDIRTAVLSADDFAIVLSALKQMNGVSIVSNPKIVVANEETASIHIGENEPNIKGTVTAGQQGQANTTTYTLDEAKPYFEFGISVDVTPTINNDSNITVRIVPKLSRFVRNKVAPDNNSFPVEATKTIKTVFSLESGKTAAIGGLTETDEREVTSKIPLLGDIPLIGKYLFSHTSKSRRQSETIIFVTVAMANPMNIQREQGIPEDAELIHQLLKNRTVTKEAHKANSGGGFKSATSIK
jgi:type IV pilus assembly protein PilQ